MLVEDNWRWSQVVPGVLRWHLGPQIDANIVGQNLAKLSMPAVGDIGSIELESEANLALKIGQYRHSQLYGSTGEALFVEVHLSPRPRGSLFSQFRFDGELPSRPLP